jgi:hypothetical protein
MQINRSHLDAAARQGLLTPEQASALWIHLSAQTADTPTFRFTHILYYLGGLIAIGAMSLFMTLGWERFGGLGLFSIALAYAIAGLWLTEHLLQRQHLPIPAGITAAFVVALTPLAIYGLQDAMGWWAEGWVYRQYHTHIDWRWIGMEVGTLVAGALLLWRYRLPFLVLPSAVTLWYMSMDLTPFLFGTEDSGGELRKIVSVGFGLGMILLAFWIDLRTYSRKDFAFWLYFFGVLAFWGGLSMLDSDSELNKFLYLCINLGMIGVGALLSRRVFAVFGALGTAGYLGHLAHKVFADSMLFPFVLSAIGLGIIILGIFWQRHERTLTTRLLPWIPGPLQELIHRRQGS